MSRNYGIQLYSVRDRTPTDMKGVLKDLAQMGYKSVEFAGFFDHSAEDIVLMLKDAGLTLSGTHSGLNDLLTDYDSTIAYHKAIGNKHYIIPGHDLSTQAKIDQFVLDVNRLQPLMEKEDIKLGYHNHAHEFLPNEDGSMIYNTLRAQTNLWLQLDTFWAYKAGEDPVKLMEELKDRLFFIHLKDGTADGKGFPLGQGTSPVKAVHDKALQMGVPMVVESETLKPSGTEEALACITYLKSLV